MLQPALSNDNGTTLRGNEQDQGPDKEFCTDSLFPDGFKTQAKRLGLISNTWAILGCNFTSISRLVSSDTLVDS